MIARARRAFPGMVVSMLLAAPAMAAPPPAHTDIAHATPVVHPVSEHRKTAQRTIRAKVSRLIRTHYRRPARSSNIIPAMAIGSPVWVNGTTESGWQQTGMASWYGGKRWAGRATSSGVRYDETQLTAAHATLPIGSRVRVTLAGSNRSVIVTINDRPGTHRRVIDLSRGAAAELGMLHSGVAVVTLSLL
jgi:rare lipoprotein A (peptidoglycan hydrolase)